jgi:hypothetical protein
MGKHKKPILPSDTEWESIKKPILPFDLKPIKEDGTIIKYDYYLMFSGTYICRDSKLYLFY